MSRRLVVAVCAVLLVLAFGILAYHEVFTFRWSDLLDPYVVKDMWSWLDRVRMPRSMWLASACLLAMTGQTLVLVRALRRNRRWRAAVQGQGTLERSPGLRLQIVLGATWLLIPLAAACSVAEARAQILQRYASGFWWGRVQSAFSSDLMNGQLAAIGIAILAALLAALISGLAWSFELSMALRMRGLKSAARMAANDDPTAVAPAKSHGPGTAQTAVLIYLWILLGALPFALGVWAFLWRLYTGHASLYKEGTYTTMLEAVARARHTLQTAVWVQLAGTILAIVITLGLLTRWRRRWPMVMTCSRPATWGRTLLWSSFCLVTAALCLLLAHPLAVESRTPWPPERLFVAYGITLEDRLEGPDTLEPAPRIEVRKQGLRVNWRVGDALEAADDLVVERRTYQQLYPSRPSPSYVLVRCHDDPPIERLQEALFAVSRAGYQEVRFCANTAEMHLRPTLGTIIRWKTTAARAHVGSKTALAPQAIRVWPTTTCQETRRRIFELRRVGHEVVLAPPEKTEAERQAEAQRAEAAAEKQEAARKQARRSRPVTCGPNQVEIPSATFTMGSESGAADERPMHQVTLSTYCIDQTTVTVAAYHAYACVQARARQSYENTIFCKWSRPDMEQLPMSGVAWDEARAFCRWTGGRLPTEAEWEYAARAKDGRLAMTGELWEWTLDDYTDYRPEPVTNPKGTFADASRRVARGTPQNGADATTREKFNPDHSDPDLGFRCVRGPFQIPTEWHRPDWPHPIPM